MGRSRNKAPWAKPAGKALEQRLEQGRAAKRRSAGLSLEEYAPPEGYGLYRPASTGYATVAPSATTGREASLSGSPAMPHAPRYARGGVIAADNRPASDYSFVEMDLADAELRILTHMHTQTVPKVTARLRDTLLGTQQTLPAGAREAALVTQVAVLREDNKAERKRLVLQGEQVRALMRQLDAARAEALRARLEVAALRAELAAVRGTDARRPRLLRNRRPKEQ